MILDVYASNATLYEIILGNYFIGLVFYRLSLN